jgi:hypothetical protein
VHIPQTPYVVADGFKRGSDDRSERARAVVAALGDERATRARWAAVAKHNTSVKTVLRKLGPDDTTSLLHHAYILAMCNLHVVLNYPLLSLPNDDEFRSLCTST